MPQDEAGNIMHEETFGQIVLSSRDAYNMHDLLDEKNQGSLRKAGDN